MHVTFDSLKTFYNILVQKLKNHRGNWNQNDPDADDYIKNRPFYSEGIQETIIIDTIVNFDNSSSNMSSSGPTVYQIMIDDYSANSFKIGETYTVIWDDQTYECVAQDISGIGAIGNASLIGYMESAGYEDTGEPFLIGANQGYGYIVLSTEDGNHTLIVKTITEVIKKLDNKFIDMPDDIVTDEELNETLNFVYDDMYWNINNLSNQVVKTVSQSLTSTKKSQARTNIGAASNDEVVKIISQTLTDTQKAQVRNNIGAGTSDFSGNYADLTNVPEILQANWEMYNPNSNAYIANKPFGYEYELEDLPLSSTEIEKLCSGTFDENTGLYVTKIIFSKLPPFDTFEDYYFVVNGKPNISKFCQYRVSEYNTSQLYLGVGNASLTWGADGLGELRDYRLYQEQSGQSWYNVKDTGEDWFLGQTQNPKGTYYTFITRKPNIQITDIHRFLSKTINQLDEKFIPDTIARVSDVVQSDWEQNDEMASDYVKNRTHYEDVVNVVALQEVTSSIFYDEPNGRYFFAPNCIFIEGVNAGETYNVHFNGLKYECTAKQEGRQIILGNESIIGLTENNGLPFIIIIPEIVVNKGITLYTTELVESVTIKITKTIEKNVHQLDEKFIPTATDDEIISMLLELDMLPAIIDSDGAILTDENNNILLW